MFDLTPYNRKNGIGKKQRDVFDIERLFENFLSDTFFSSLYGAGDIKVDVRENEKEYIVEAELPGINKEEINVELRDDNLTISVERNEIINEEREGFIKRERKSGSYSRTFYIPDVKQKEVKAKYENGLLTLVLPKQEPGTVRGNRINIE